MATMPRRFALVPGLVLALAIHFAAGGSARADELDDIA